MPLGEDETNRPHRPQDLGMGWLWCRDLAGGKLDLFSGTESSSHIQSHEIGWNLMKLVILIWADMGWPICPLSCHLPGSADTFPTIANHQKTAWFCFRRNADQVWKYLYPNLSSFICWTSHLLLAWRSVCSFQKQLVEQFCFTMWLMWDPKFFSSKRHVWPRCDSHPFAGKPWAVSKIRAYHGC